MAPVAAPSTRREFVTRTAAALGVASAAPAPRAVAAPHRSHGAAPPAFEFNSPLGPIRVTVYRDVDAVPAELRHLATREAGGGPGVAVTTYIAGGPGSSAASPAGDRPITR